MNNLAKISHVIVGFGSAISVTYGIFTPSLLPLIVGVCGVCGTILRINHDASKDAVLQNEMDNIKTTAKKIEDLEEEPILSVIGLSIEFENLDAGSVGELTVTLLNQSKKSINDLMIMHLVDSNIRPYLELFDPMLQNMSQFFHQGNSTLIPNTPYQFKSPLYGKIQNQNKFYIYLWLNYKFNKKEYGNIIEIEYVNNQLQIIGQHNDENIKSFRKKLSWFYHH